MGKLRRKVLAVATIVVVVLAFQTPAHASTVKRTAAFVGDSITYISGHAISKAFKRYEVIGFAATPGADMAYMLPTVKNIAATNPFVFVIELGTNDAYYNIPDWQTHFNNEVAAITSVHCVVLLTVNPNLGPSAPGLNQAMYYATLSHRNIHELDWGNIQLQNPAWLGPDHVHPTPAGSRVMATLEWRAARGC
jgi:hypothetical protein